MFFRWLTSGKKSTELDKLEDGTTLVLQYPLVDTKKHGLYTKKDPVFSTGRIWKGLRDKQGQHLWLPDKQTEEQKEEMIGPSSQRQPRLKSKIPNFYSPPHPFFFLPFQHVLCVYYEAGC